MHRRDLSRIAACRVAVSCVAFALASAALAARAQPAPPSRSGSSHPPGSPPSGPSPAEPSALDAPLRGFSTNELDLIAPLLGQGVVGLVELPRGDALPGIHLAAVVEAPASVVRDVLARPSAYPSFMPAVSEVVEHERHDDAVAFTWRWRTSIFALGGDATLTRFEPPPDDSARGYRFVFERTRGDLGQGREVWRVLPRGSRESLVLVSTRMDLRDANYLTRQMASASLSLNRSINLAMGLGTLTRVRLEAERRSGGSSPRAEDVASSRAAPRTFTAPAVDPARLESLLRRGDLVIVGVRGAQLEQTSIVTRLPHAEASVRAIMLDPVAFAQALISGSRAVVRQRSAEGVLFDWAIDLPLIGTGGSMRLREAEDRTVHLDAVSGAMSGGGWRFSTRVLPSGATAVTGWARFDVSGANFLLRAIVDADASFQPGLSAATEVMMARALRARLDR